MSVRDESLSEGRRQINKFMYRQVCRDTHRNSVALISKHHAPPIWKTYIELTRYVKGKEIEIDLEKNNIAVENRTVPGKR